MKSIFDYEPKSEEETEEEVSSEEPEIGTDLSEVIEEYGSGISLNFKLLHGDAEEMLGKLNDSSVDLICSSPPYLSMRGELSWDSFEDYIIKMQSIMEECFRVLKPGKVIAINVSDYIEEGIRYDVAWHWHGMLKRCGFKYRDTIVWRKTGQLATISAGKMASNVLKHRLPMYYSPDRMSESIFIFTKGRHKIPRYNQKITDLSYLSYIPEDWLGNIWSFAPRQDKEHKAVFPQELPKRIISLYSYAGEVVLDPFMGTGTTMRVAKDLNRSCIGCEFVDEYIDITKRTVGWGEQGLDGVDYKYELVEEE